MNVSLVSRGTGQKLPSSALLRPELEVIWGVVRLMRRNMLRNHLSGFDHTQLLNLKKVVDENEQLLCISHDSRLDTRVTSSETISMPALTFAFEDCEVSFTEGECTGSVGDGGTEDFVEAVTAGKGSWLTAEN
jgi:hypothetical protein